MARPLRLEFPGALYHLIARGNARAKIIRIVTSESGGGLDFAARLIAQGK